MRYKTEYEFMVEEDIVDVNSPLSLRSIFKE